MILRFGSMLLIMTLVSCGPASEPAFQFTATIHPLAAILSELCSGRAEVVRLVDPGLSPHTYEPRPTDVRDASQSRALFYVAEDIDGWAARIPALRRIEVAPLVPEPRRLPWMEDAHRHEVASQDSSWNTHFWSDPDLVSEMIPALVDHLVALDPEGAQAYRENAERFGRELGELDERIETQLAPLKGRAVAVFHPSWDYFLHRYGIPIAGVVEPFPGREATPKYLEELTQHLVAEGIYAVCTEPQLPRRPAEVVAETCNAAQPPRPVRICEIDPNGGVPGRERFAELLEYNAAQLAEVLQ